MRRLGVLFTSLVVTAFFIAGFYLYYVPKNKADLNRYGFLILQEVEAAMQSKISANVESLAGNLQNLYDPNKDTAAVRRQLSDYFGIDSVIDYRTIDKKTGSNPVKGAHGSKHKGLANEDTAQLRFRGRLEDIGNDRIRYCFWRGKNNDHITMSAPIPTLLDPLQGAFPRDFYSGLLFFKVDSNKTTMIYDGARLPLGRSIPVDSLLKGSRRGLFPGIAEAQLGGGDYMLFYVPLTLAGHQYVLCGVKVAEEYMRVSHELPSIFIYSLVIPFLLLLVAIPLIKLWFIGPGEAIKLRDMAGYFLSLLVGSMLLVLTIIHVILLRDGNERQETELKTLTGQLATGFTGELQQAYRQLSAIDSARAADPHCWELQGDNQSFNKDVTDSLIGYELPLAKSFVSKIDPSMRIESPALRPDSPATWLWFDRVAWVNDAGWQNVAATLNPKIAPLFLSVAQRGYYTDFKGDNCFRLPGIPHSLLSLQAVLSWADGKFRFVMAKPSVCSDPDHYLVTMSVDLVSVNQPVMPENYWFCIVDGNGLVQVHSDASKNLIDNILQETPDSAMLQGAMNARRELDLDDVTLYGQHDFGLRLVPIDGLPLYLVVFHYRGDILPVNVRILTFSIVAYLLTLAIGIGVFFICWAIRGVIYGRRWNPLRSLSLTIDQLLWLGPRPENARFYCWGWIWLLSYTAVLIILVLTGVLTTTDRAPIILLVVSPALVAAGLGVIAVLDRAPQKIIPHYLRHYSLLLLSLSLTLGALPVALFTWHAQNQEIVQSVKRAQLSEARSIQSRQTIVDTVLTMEDRLFPNRIFMDYQYRQGIYTVLGERRRLDTLSAGRQPSTGFYQTYFDVAAQLGADYFEPNELPVLSDAAADQGWYWNGPAGDSLFFEFTLAPDVYDPNLGSDIVAAERAPTRRLQIESRMPERYPFFEKPLNVVLLILLTGVLLYGLYWIIRRLSGAIFLQSVIRDTPARPPTAAALPRISEYFVIKKIDIHRRERELDEMQAEILPAEGASPDNTHGPAGLRSSADEEERAVLRLAQKHAEYFAFLLAGCKPAELVLLYHFATYGLLNYKNSPEISHLLDEGILVVDDWRVRMFSRIFRAHLLLNVPTAALQSQPGEQSAWQRFRLPFLILMLAAAAFLFFTREEAWQRVTALIAAFSTTLGLLQGIFKEEGKKEDPGKIVEADKGKVGE